MTTQRGFEFVGGTPDIPPPGKPGDIWNRPDAPLLRMNDDGEWIPDYDPGRAGVYGVCTTCGADRTVVPVQEDMSLMGQLTVQFGLVCSVDRGHTQDAP